MKANEFVKEFGLEEAKRKLTKIDNCFVSGVIFDNAYGYEMIKDLKRLVESHELLEVCGGLECAKNLGGDDLYAFFKHPFMPSFSDIDQAILDVESCK